MSETKLSIRMSLKFSRVCRTQSNLVYPDFNDPRESAARFFKEAAKEKLASLTINGKRKFSDEYIKSLF